MIDSGLRASTATMIQLAKPFFKSGGDRLLQQFDQLSWSVYESLHQGHVNAVGAAMNECGDLLRSAALLPDVVERMIQVCRKIGLPGMKITGAGGGGVILGLLDPENADVQREAVKRAFPGHSVFAAAIGS